MKFQNGNNNMGYTCNDVWIFAFNIAALGDVYMFNNSLIKYIKIYLIISI